ncbi:MAG: aspartate--tRNA ligase [Phycisphaerae bacterium]
MQTYSPEVLKRTHTCGQLRKDDCGQTIRLAGWVRSYRDHGGVVFIDLRDREGVTQVVFDTPGENADQAALDMYTLARALRNEWVIAIEGLVRPRGEGNENPKLPTGQIEVLGTELTLLNKSDTVPFEPDEFQEVGEETRLKYRYIDIRRPSMTHNLMLRHKICKAMRDTLDAEGFVEVETPFLTKSTPEGARDFLVPSRSQSGEFYALPQSPQLFKQILMVGGLDKYYQIVRCFRDEDLRADRQPEFTQLDMEMSFCTEQDVMEVTNELMRAVCETAGKPFPDDVTVISYPDAIEKYGIDRPDLRFEMLLSDVGEIVKQTDFKVFTGALDAGGIVKCICPKGGAKFTRKEIDNYTALVADYGAKGLAWVKREDGQWNGGIAKFLSDEVRAQLAEATGAEDGDILMFLADKPRIVNAGLAALRSRLARDLGLIDPDAFAWCWVVDFPLLEYSEEDGRWYSLHHPFTMPHPDDLDKLASDPGSVRSWAYDIVCNGLEMGGGSIRIHDPEIQKQVFGILGISDEEAAVKFSFLLDALRFGAPPHGGLALGLDRIAMVMTGGTSLREVIAFPKTQRGTCPLTDAPGPVEDMQLAELSLRVISPAKEKK